MESNPSLLEKISNTLTSVANGLTYFKVLQKNFFGAKLPQNPSITDRVADLCMSPLHLINGAKFVHVDKTLSSYKTIQTNLCRPGITSDYVTIGIIEIFLILGIPLGFALKSIALLDSETRKCFFEVIELQYAELKKRIKFNPAKQDNCLSKLPKGVQNLIFMQLGVKDLASLSLASKEWAVKTKKELYFKSLSFELQNIFSRYFLEQHSTELSLKHHRAGQAIKPFTKEIDEYLVQPFDSHLPPSPFVTLEAKDMKDKSLVVGRDPWGRPYLALHLVYSQEKSETILTIQPKIRNAFSAWHTKETLIGDMRPKNSLKTSKDFMKLLGDLIDKKSAILGEGENQTSVKLWEAADSTSNFWKAYLPFFKG